MTDNDRTRRSPRTERTEPDEAAPSGHDLIDVAARRTSREDASPETDEPEVRRTRRAAGSSGENDSTERSSRNEDARINLPGNLSETGAGSPTPEQTGTRQLPGKPPVGCSTTTGVLITLACLLGVTVGKLIRR